MTLHSSTTFLGSMNRSWRTYTRSHISFSVTEIMGVKVRSGCFSAGQVVIAALSVLPLYSGFNTVLENGVLLFITALRFFSGAWLFMDDCETVDLKGTFAISWCYPLFGVPQSDRYCCQSLPAFVVIGEYNYLFLVFVFCRVWIESSLPTAVICLLDFY